MKTTVEPEAHAAGAMHEADLRPSLPTAQAAVVPQVSLPYHPVHSLQMSLGNQGTRRALTAGTLQPKLRVGAPDDVYEKEADEVAEQMMSLQRSFSAAGASGSDDDKNNSRRAGGGTASQELAQRKMLQRIPIRTLQQKLGNRAFARLLQQTLPAPATPELSRKCACGGGEKEGSTESGQGRIALRRSAASADLTDSEAPPIVEDVLATAGQPLADSVRRTLEPSFGRDFSGVRVHDDSRAAESASAVNALAYTVGDHIVFGEGQYAPGTSDGNRLLAHELTHVVQQSGVMGRGQASRSVIQRDVGSDDYNQGYQDGLSGGESNAVPRDGDALTDYNEGYARGHYEFGQQSSTAAPADQTTAPASSQGSAPGPADQAPASGVDVTSPDYAQGYQDGLSGGDSHAVPRDGGALADYDEGYARGHYEFSQQSSSGGSTGPNASIVPGSPPGSLAAALPSGVDVKGGSVSFQLPGDKALSSSTLSDVVTTDSTTVTLSITSESLQVSFSPPILIKPLLLANMEWSGLTYTFATASVSIALTGGITSPEGTARQEITDDFLGLIAGTPVAVAGYDPATDPDVTGTLNQIKTNFNNAPSKGGGGVTAADVTNIAVTGHIELQPPIVADGLTISNGVTITARIRGSAASVGATGPVVDSLAISGDSIMVQSDGADVAQIHDLTVANGGAVTLGRVTLLGVAKEAAKTEEGLRLLALIGLLSLGTASDRPALANAQPNLDAEIVQGLTRLKIQDALTKAIRDLIVQHADAIPGYDLSTIFGVDRPGDFPLGPPGGGQNQPG